MKTLYKIIFLFSILLFVNNLFSQNINTNSLGLDTSKLVILSQFYSYDIAGNDYYIVTVICKKIIKLTPNRNIYLQNMMPFTMTKGDNIAFIYDKKMNLLMEFTRNNF